MLVSHGATASSSRTPMTEKKPGLPWCLICNLAPAFAAAMAASRTTGNQFPIPERSVGYDKHAEGATCCLAVACRLHGSQISSRKCAHSEEKREARARKRSSEHPPGCRYTGGDSGTKPAEALTRSSIARRFASRSAGDGQAMLACEEWLLRTLKRIWTCGPLGQDRDCQALALRAHS